MSDKEKFDVNSPDEFFKIMKDRQEKARKRIVNDDVLTDDNARYRHEDAANLFLKVLNVLKVDPMVKKIVNMRVLAPLTTGKERTHMSIALELGLREFEVKQMEEAGVNIISEHLEKTSSADFIEKFNREKKLVNAIKNMGKSGEPEVQGG